MKIVTGRIGRPHVTSNQIQTLNRSILGDFALLDIGTKFRADVLSPNIIRINDGAVVVQGVYAITPNDEYDDIYIPTVTVGYQRIDTIYLHYIKDSTNDTETFEIDVEQGEEVIDYPVPPTIVPGGDIWEGATDVRVPIYDVLVTSFGLTVTPYERMETTSVTIEELKEMIDDIDIPSDLVQRVIALERDKVDKVEGKGLSTNDYTDEDKDKLDDIEDGAQENVIESISVNGTPQTVTNKNVALTVMTNAVNDLVNYYRKSETYTQAEVDALISAIVTLDIKAVNSLPTTNISTTTIYLVPKAQVETQNVKDEYINTTGTSAGWEKIGDTEIDLSGYVTTTALNTALVNKVDKVAGKGLSTEDYTTAEKTKLAGLENYDDSEIREEIEGAKTVDDSVITIDDAAPINAESVVVDIEPYQEGSGDPSPSNVRPIHGWNECKISGAGKNLLRNFTGNRTINGITFTVNDDGTITANGTATAQCNFQFSFSIEDRPIPIIEKLAGQRIIISGGKDRYAYVSITDSQHAESVGTSYMDYFTIPPEMSWSAYNAYIQIANGQTLNNYIFKPMIRLAEIEDDTYEPYQGEEYTIDFGDTIYGGRLDVTKGELVVDRGYIASYNGELLPSTWISDRDVYASGTNPTTGAQVVYELATPYTIKLTPQQIKLLENTNTLYANCGDITLKYQSNNALGKALEVAENGYDAQIEALWEKIKCPATAAAHNAMPPRGKDITSYVTDGTLWNRIAGTGGFEAFEDIFLGDYIDMTASVTAPGSTVTGTNRIVVGGFNQQWNNNGGMRFNHLTMIPETHFGNAIMNDTNTTVGGYVGSKMNTDTIGAVASSGNANGTINQQLYAIFGSHLKTVPEILSNAMTATLYNKTGSATGASSGLAWTNVQAVLLSEVETYGSVVWSSSGYDTGTAKNQLPLFRFKPDELIPNGVYYWLKDVASGSDFCRAYAGGFADVTGAGNRGGVRPRFIIA